MRCVVGVLLFVVLYFGSCMVLKEAVTVRSGKAAAARVLKTYHAPVAVAAGIVAIVGCTLPTLLMRMSERSAWREYEDYQRR
jgi:hypothetical protein